MSKKRILIVYYSFSGQTQLLIQRLITGIKEYDVDVELERLQPAQQISFPFASWTKMSQVMAMSFFRRRVPIRPVDHLLEGKWDLVLLAGPTWSYNPSGPVLAFLDRYGEAICGNTKVLPFISCRSYWRMHFWGLKRIYVTMRLKFSRRSSTCIRPANLGGLLACSFS